MTATRKIAAIPIVGAALALIAFGVVRGAMKAGPAHGVRMRITVEPPLDDAVLAMAARVVSERLEEKGADVRVVTAREGLVVEVGEDDREIVGAMAAIIERTATLAVRVVDSANPWLASVTAYAASDPMAPLAGVRVERGVLVADDRDAKLDVAVAKEIGCKAPVDSQGTVPCKVAGNRALALYLDKLAEREPRFKRPIEPTIAYGPSGSTASRRVGRYTWRTYALGPEPTLDGRTIRRVDIDAGGVTIESNDTATLAKLANQPVAFSLETRVHFVGMPDRIDGPHLHVPTPGATEDAAIGAALELAAVIRTGAVHPMRVVHQEMFTRTTGFWPRAWPFLVAGAVLLFLPVPLLRRPS